MLLDRVYRGGMSSSRTRRRTEARRKKLASVIEQRGHTVWWDTSLLPHERFTEAILRELELAKAVIVIWSPASVKSAWVISEATRAFKQNKLIQVRTPDLPISNISNIPPPFDVVHCSPVGDRAAIFNALRHLGIGEGAIEGDAAAEPASGRRRLWLASAAIVAGVVLAVRVSSNGSGCPINQSRSRPHLPLLRQSLNRQASWFLQAHPKPRWFWCPLAR